MLVLPHHSSEDKDLKYSFSQGGGSFSRAMISPARFHLLSGERIEKLLRAPGPVVGKPGLSLQDFVKNMCFSGWFKCMEGY